MYEFGVGALFATNSDGSSIEFGTLQDVSLDFSFDKKELYGRRQFPVHVARGKGKIEGKATYANIQAAALNAVLNGTISTGELIIAEPVTTSIPATTPYTITITPPSSGTINSVLQVYNVSGTTKVPMKLVTGTPTTGQYAYATGTLTFAAADAGKAIQYQYSYNITAGQTLQMTNSMMGTAPTFQVELYQTLDNLPLTIVLYKVTTEKLSMSMKNEDYMIPDFSFSAYANAADSVGNIYLSE